MADCHSIIHELLFGYSLPESTITSRFLVVRPTKSSFSLSPVPGLGFRPMPPESNVESTLVWYKASSEDNMKYWINELDDQLKGESDLSCLTTQRLTKESSSSSSSPSQCTTTRRTPSTARTATSISPPRKASRARWTRPCGIRARPTTNTTSTRERRAYS